MKEYLKIIASILLSLFVIALFFAYPFTYYETIKSSEFGIDENFNFLLIVWPFLIALGAMKMLGFVGSIIWYIFFKRLSKEGYTYKAHQKSAIAATVVMTLLCLLIFSDIAILLPFMIVTVLGSLFFMKIIFYKNKT